MYPPPSEYRITATQDCGIANADCIMHVIGNTASNAGKSLVLQVGRRLTSRVNHTVAAQKQCLSLRLDMSTVAGGWADPTIASSKTKTDGITEGADRPSRVMSITPSSRKIGLQAVQRWKREGNKSAERDARNRVQRRARLATTETGESDPFRSAYGETMEGGHTRSPGVHYKRNPAEMGKSPRRNQMTDVPDDQTDAHGQCQVGNRARSPGVAYRGSTNAHHHRNDDGGRSKSNRVMATIIPAPAATGSQVEQASIMRRLKLAKRRRDNEEAKRILEDALAQDNAAELVDVFVFSATIGIFAKTGEWESAMDVLGVMREKGVKPNEFTYNQTITACANGGAWKWAVYLLKAMPKMGVSPDVVSYNAAIAACAKGKQSELAVVLLREMTEAGLVAPNALTYSTVMSAVAETSGTLTGSTAAGAPAVRWKRIVGLLEEMRGGNIAPDATGYGLAVAACAEGGQADMAVKLLRQMYREDHITPDLNSYNAVMTACHEAGKWELAVLLLRDAKETDGVNPDRVTYTNAIESCRKGGQPGLAATLEKEMTDAGI